MKNKIGEDHATTFRHEQLLLRRQKQWVTLWLWCLSLSWCFIGGTMAILWSEYGWPTMPPVFYFAGAAILLLFVTMSSALAFCLMGQRRQWTERELLNELQFDVYMAVTESIGEVLGRFGSGHAAYRTSLDLGEALLPAAELVSQRQARLETALARLLPELKLQDAIIEIVKQATVGQSLIPTVEDFDKVLSRLMAAYNTIEQTNPNEVIKLHQPPSTAAE
ncbi:MAG: hypothetical protein RLZZ360_909 [Candidatus Parcubacteria bacterium]